MLTMFKRLAAIMFAIGLFATQALPAFACGGLVAPNGAVRLARATTLVAWHDGIERYMTSFTYQGDASNLGWIVPLPTVPLKIEEGGAWTLQRLFLETHPAIFGAHLAQAAATADDKAQVLQQVQVEALNITVIKGSGQAVLNWVTGNGFFLDGDTRAHLLIYAKGSPIFMAVKYDTARAHARGQLQGDGAPVLITMKTEHPWVPLEVLALDGQQVHADIYLLTDEPVYTSDRAAEFGLSPVGTEIPGAPGFQVTFQEKLNPRLFHDLSTDRNMSWVRPGSWLTYLSLDAPDTKVTYDMGITSMGVIRLAPFGTEPMAVADGPRTQGVPGAQAWGVVQVLLTLGLAVVIGGGLVSIVRRRMRSPVK